MPTNLSDCKSYNLNRGSLIRDIDREYLIDNYIKRRIQEYVSQINKKSISMIDREEEEEILRVSGNHSFSWTSNQTPHELNLNEPQQETSMKLLSLFLKLDPKRTTNYHKNREQQAMNRRFQRRCMTPRRLRRRTRYKILEEGVCLSNISRNQIISYLIHIFILGLIGTSSSVLAAQSAASIELPTVIVRGFLNYRTTVDGTVLLFTPDAAGSSSTSSLSMSSSVSASASGNGNGAPQPAATGSQMAASKTVGPADSWSSIISATKTSQRETSYATGTPQLIGGQQDVSPPATESVRRAHHSDPPGTNRAGDWHVSPHHHRPTPPLDTVSRPRVGSLGNSEASKADDDSNLPTIVTISSQDNNQQEEASNGHKSTPSVQSDEIVLGSGQAEPISRSDLISVNLFESRAGQIQSSGSSEAGAPVSSSNANPIAPKSQQHQPGWLPKRPSRGSMAKAFPPSSSSGGLRKPSLISGSTEGATVRSSTPLADPGTAITLNNSFQSRLANANAKMRSRFKNRPFANAKEANSSSSLAKQTQKSNAATTESPASKAQSAQSSATTEGNSQASSPVVGSEEIVAPGELQAASEGGKQLNSRKGDQAPQQDQQQQDKATSGPAGLASGAISFSQGELTSGTSPFDTAFSDPETSSSTASSQELGSESKMTQQKDDNNKMLTYNSTQNITSTNGTQKQITSQLVEPQATSISMQTITKTYSTIMTSLKTRIVPLQVKSSTGVHTITEQYVITKMLTAYQTMPVGDFLAPDSLSTRAPFELFNEKPAASGPNSQHDPADQHVEQPIQAPAQVISPSPLTSSGDAQVAPEQLISRQQPSASDWLHDLQNNNNNNNNNGGQDSLANALLGGASDPLDESQLLSQQLNNLLGQNNNNHNHNNNEPLDELASSLDPNNNGASTIPDLNNPLVLAAAIQNPQLAAAILTAQQMHLKQLASSANSKQQLSSNNNNFIQRLSAPPNQQVQLQASFSTTFSTVIKPSTYTARDTMYTTRLVSFKDGRTVRTRTVSEPGSVIEQVLTTMATEITPVTLTIRPTGALGAQLATAAPIANQQAAQTVALKNAILAAQLSQLLARRQQQVSHALLPSPSTVGGNNQQLLALQQLLRQQQQQQQQQNVMSSASAKFQPNFQQLLASMQQQPQSPSQSQQQSQSQQPQPASAGPPPTAPPAPTPPLPSIPNVTTLSSLHVRTYTVHNAFKTIYRTITSTELITSTLFPVSSSSQKAAL